MKLIPLHVQAVAAIGSAQAQQTPPEDPLSESVKSARHHFIVSSLLRLLAPVPCTCVPGSTAAS